MVLWVRCFPIAFSIFSTNSYLWSLQGGVSCFPIRQYHFKAMTSPPLSPCWLDFLAIQLRLPLLLFSLSSFHSPSFTQDLGTWIAAVASCISMPMWTSSSDLLFQSTSTPHSCSNTAGLAIMCNRLSSRMGNPRPYKMASAMVTSFMVTNAFCCRNSMATTRSFSLQHLALLTMSSFLKLSLKDWYHNLLIFLLPLWLLFYFIITASSFFLRGILLVL